MASRRLTQLLAPFAALTSLLIGSVFPSVPLGRTTKDPRLNRDELIGMDGKEFIPKGPVGMVGALVTPLGEYLQ